MFSREGPPPTDAELKAEALGDKRREALARLANSFSTPEQIETVVNGGQVTAERYFHQRACLRSLRELGGWDNDDRLIQELNDRLQRRNEREKGYPPPTKHIDLRGQPWPDKFEPGVVYTFS